MLSIELSEINGDLSLNREFSYTVLCNISSLAAYGPAVTCGRGMLVPQGHRQDAGRQTAVAAPDASQVQEARLQGQGALWTHSLRRQGKWDKLKYFGVE